ncbi:MAG: carbohydrate-binding domain-containing protein [Lachnospiraceae bacterium]|nr:carbohydrate-binding domain-containing protein [Lachnospiraceae bacterium]
MKKKLIKVIFSAITALMLAACTINPDTVKDISENITSVESSADTGSMTEGLSVTESSATAIGNGNVHEDFTKSFVVVTDEDITIDDEGIYEITGSAQNVTVYVDCEDEDEVTILLSGTEITNDDMPCVYVCNAGEVKIETSENTVNTLKVTGDFKEDGDENPDAVIYSKDDLILKGSGTLKIESSDNGVRSNDDLKIKNGTYEITCVNDVLKANEKLEIEDGTLILCGSECLEATQITINAGNIDITATDDGINASQKSSTLSPVFTLNGGNVVIKMGAGDTDGVDSNGDIYINGGTIDITGQFAFDYDGVAEHTGGTIIENGNEIQTITNQFSNGFGGGKENFGNSDLDGKFMTPPDMDGEFMTPPDMDGEFMTPPDMGGSDITPPTKEKRQR